MRRPPTLGAVLVLAAALPACTALEPRAEDSCPAKVLKGVAYVPGSILYGAGALRALLVAGTSRRQGEQMLIDDELGRPRSESYDLWSR